jgi:hypothetical protein
MWGEEMYFTVVLINKHSGTSSRSIWVFLPDRGPLLFTWWLKTIAFLKTMQYLSLMGLRGNFAFLHDFCGPVPIIMIGTCADDCAFFFPQFLNIVPAEWLLSGSCLLPLFAICVRRRIRCRAYIVIHNEYLTTSSSLHSATRDADDRLPLAITPLCMSRALQPPHCPYLRYSCSSVTQTRFRMHVKNATSSPCDWGTKYNSSKNWGSTKPWNLFM